MSDSECTCNVDAMEVCEACRDAELNAVQAEVAGLRVRARDAEIWRDRNYARIEVLETALRNIDIASSMVDPDEAASRCGVLARRALAPAKEETCRECGGRGWNWTPMGEGHEPAKYPCLTCGPDHGPSQEK